VVGNEPGAYKWNKAKEKGIKRVPLSSLRDALAAPDVSCINIGVLKDAETPESFSAGFRPRSPFFVSLRQVPAGDGKAIVEASTLFLSAMAVEPLKDWGHGNFMFGSDAETRYLAIFKAEFAGFRAVRLAGAAFFQGRIHIPPESGGGGSRPSLLVVTRVQSGALEKGAHITCEKMPFGTSVTLDNLVEGAGGVGTYTLEMEPRMNSLHSLDSDSPQLHGTCVDSALLVHDANDGALTDGCFIGKLFPATFGGKKAVVRFGLPPNTTSGGVGVYKLTGELDSWAGARAPKFLSFIAGHLPDDGRDALLLESLVVDCSIALRDHLLGALKVAWDVACKSIPKPTGTPFTSFDLLDEKVRLFVPNPPARPPARYTQELAPSHAPSSRDHPRAKPARVLSIPIFIGTSWEHWTVMLLSSIRGV
jgi:hypothetical protein